MQIAITLFEVNLAEFIKSLKMCMSYNPVFDFYFLFYYILR
jgi:hypothetical protein